MTPIESLIEEMKFRNKHDVVLRLQIMLVHEKYFMRKVAENAWDACRKSTVDNASIEHDPVRDMEFIEIDYTSIEKDKQTYLNQNHPLC